MNYFLNGFLNIYCDDIINSCNKSKGIICHEILNRTMNSCNKSAYINNRRIILHRIENICVNVSRNNNYIDVTNILLYILKKLKILNMTFYFCVNFKFNNRIDDITCINNITIIDVVIKNKKYYGIHLLKEILKIYIIREVFSKITIINMKSIEKLQKYKNKFLFRMYSDSCLFRF